MHKQVAFRTVFFLVLCGSLGLMAVVHRLESAEPTATLAASLRDLNATIIPPDSEQGKELPQMLATDARNRIRAANQRETKAWNELQSRAAWEKYKQARLEALRASLGQPLEAPKDLKVRVTRTLEGEGYKIENLVFESRPGLLVTANLYSPTEPTKSMPGFIISASHHNPKTQAELQDMGMTWARLGCLVIVPDHLGHGERRAHPFVNEQSYAGSFRPGRQDYYFRYNTAMQLHVIGESLIGWMVWDLSRCVDVLLARPGIDKERIILLGAVAGGGDPAAVTAALDPRIACVVPFNFGGPQPETVYPLPADAETAFNYAGSGSWESTRNLRLSARDGFLPWVIVGSVAPRRVIHAHEFAWDKERDPVWVRYQKIFAWYNAPDHLDAAKGRGSVKGKAGPDNTHCNNIGPEHRKELYPALNRWFGMNHAPEKEYQVRREAHELLCLTSASGIKLRPLHELAGALASERLAAARQTLTGLAQEARVQKLRQDWARLLGEIEPREVPRAAASPAQQLGEVTVERFVLHVEPGIVVPTLLLLPPRKNQAKLPVVVAFAQQGKQEFLKNRADSLAELLAGGTAVCLPDLRGTGETRLPGDSRSRTSPSTAVSATELMVGRTLLGLRLKDLRAVLRYVRSRPELDAGRLALWGDSFAPPNADGVPIEVPWDAAKLPTQSEPLGGLLALLAALYEPEVRAIYAQGGLSGYQAILQSPFIYVPHDAVVPGALQTGDLGDVAAALAPRPLRLEGLVDGVNRRVASEALARLYEPTYAAYRSAGAQEKFALGATPAKPAVWLLAQLSAR